MKTGGSALCALVLLVLATTCLQLASAVDITVYEEKGCCGVAYKCPSIAAGTCCEVRKGRVRRSMQLQFARPCFQGRVFSGDRCTYPMGLSNGNGCISRDQLISSAKWFNSCRRPDGELWAAVEENDHDHDTGCTNFVEPTAVLYREPASKGSWVLNKDDAVDMFEKLTNLPDTEKVAWLIAQGATFESETENELEETISQVV